MMKTFSKDKVLHLKNENERNSHSNLARIAEKVQQAFLSKLSLVWREKEKHN